MKKALTTLLALLSLLCALLVSAQQLPPTFSSLAFVHAHKDEDWNGTGFFAAPDLVFTAAHVLSFIDPISDERIPLKVGDDVWISLSPNSESKVKGYVYYRHPTYDIGVIKVTEYKSATYLKITLKKPSLGAPVKITGFFGNKKSPFLILGNVSGIVEFNWSDGTVKDEEQEMVFYAPSGLPGCSGAPVMDTEGYVFAIHVGSFRSYGIGTPLWKIEKDLKEFIKPPMD